MQDRTPLYLHIGMGKTGTTALQHFFHQNREQLAARGIDYPDYHLVEGAHHRLSPHIPPFLAHHWDFIDPAEWAPELRARGADRTLLSSELISSARPPVVAAFAKKIRPHFDVRIVIYFRRQDHLITSAYNQQVKAGTMTMPFEVMLERQFVRFDFPKVLEPWVEAFGEENIIVVPYERDQFFEGDIRKDFLRRVLAIEDMDGFTFERQERNPGLSYGAAEFKRLVNGVIANPDFANMFNPVLQTYSEDAEGAGKYPSRSPCPAVVRRQILKRCAEGNALVARKYTGNPDGVLFREPVPELDANATDAEFSEDELRGILRYIHAHEPDLVDVLQAKIADARDENRFESYYASKRLTDAMNMAFRTEAGARHAGPDDEGIPASPDYVHRLRSVDGTRLAWFSDNGFELDGCRFAIVPAAGEVATPGDRADFTIVKTRKLLGAYLDMPLPEGINVLGLGISRGGSLAFMERLFKPRRIVGVDLAKEPVAALEAYKRDHPSVSTHYGVSQDDQRKIPVIIADEFDGPIDLIVDDASHLHEQTKKSFELTFPFLRPGGFYVIEKRTELVGPLHQVSDGMTGFLANLVGDGTLCGAIDSMFVQVNLIIIRKSLGAVARLPRDAETHRGRADPSI